MYANNRVSRRMAYATRHDLPKPPAPLTVSVPRSIALKGVTITITAMQSTPPAKDHLQRLPLAVVGGRYA